MLAAASMCARAPRSPPSSTAGRNQRWISRIASVAMPSASGWKPGAHSASRLCESASNPVQAVSVRGRPSVSSGSAITWPGSMRGWNTMHLVWSASLVITAARPTSEPVPAVVGIATTGRIPSAPRPLPVVAAVLEVPQRPRLAGHEGDRLGGVEAAAAAERDHAVVRARAHRRDPVLDVATGRVRPDRGEQAAGLPGAARDLEHPAPERVLGEPGIGDQQRPADAERPAGVGQLDDPAGAEAHPGRVAPVAAQRPRIDRRHA